MGVYQRHHYTDEKRLALEAWARFVLSLQQHADTVVLLKVGSAQP